MVAAVWSHAVGLGDARRLLVESPIPVCLAGSPLASGLRVVWLGAVDCCDLAY